MTTFVTGVLEARAPGSDNMVCWLTLRPTRGGLLRAIFDYQGISQALVIGRTYELALELTYPCQHGSSDDCWQGIVVDPFWPKPAQGVARAPFQRTKGDRSPTGPTCVLVQAPFGQLLSSVSQLQHHLPTLPRAGSSFTCPYTQRLDVLAVLT